MPVPAIDRSLGLRPDLRLSPEQAEMVRFLEDTDLWFVQERLARKGIVETGRIPHAVREFKRYMVLVGLGYRGLGMLSPEIDEVWHAFILFTREYADFCQQAFGMFIHHVPRTSRSPRSEASGEAFLSAYAEVFGESELRDYALTARPDAAMGDEPSGCGTEDCTSG
jgi:hypothetical protein